MLSCRNVVLVVEDHALIRALTCELLESAGFDVVEADGAMAALEVLEGRDDIDLLLTDIAMPGPLDGIGLTKFVRDRWPPVKLIVATGKQSIDQRDLPESARLFHKPFNGYAVVEAVVEMLQAA